MTRDEIAKINPDALFCDGFDDAILGIAETPNHGPVVAYSIETMLQIMVERDGMTHEEAYEYFDVNIRRAYVGDNTPIYITTVL